MMLRKTMVPLVAAALLAAGCASDGDRFGSQWGAKEKGTAAGAAGGAATGAVISGATGGNILGGAAIGGLAGGLAGYFFGDRVFKDDKAVAQPSASASTSGAAAADRCPQANDYFRQAVAADDLQRKADLYQRGLDLCPNNAYAHNDLGTVYLRMGKPDQAKAEYRRALELKPDMEETRRNLELLG